MSKLKDLIKTTRKANPEGSTLRQAISQARRGESVNVVPREINPVMEVPRFEPVERVASTPPARSTSRWSGAAPSSRGGGFGETESQGEGYFFQSRYGAKDRANDFLQGTLTGVAGTIGSAATTLLDAADQAARDFVQHTLTLPEGVLEEKGLDTPEMRESIQRFNETMDRENPLIQDLYHISDSAIQKGATQFERSKSGWGPLGSAALDVGRLGVEMLTDAAFGAVTGGSGLAPMVARSFGGGAAQARSEGATTQEALLSGAGQGGIDYATERLFGVALPFARLYGGGSLDDVVQRGIQSAVSRFASTEAGQRALGGGLTVAASALTEGAEEFLADWASWQLPRIYDGDVASVEETLSNSLYDFMLGSVMGGLGGVVSPSTYNYQSGTTAASANPTRQAVEMLSRGEEISGSQATRIARDPEALSLLQELTGQEINTDAPISQVRSNIQAVAAARRGTAPVQTQTQENTQAQQGAVPAASQEARTAAQQVYDVNRMQRAASSTGMGESGQRAISAAYDGNVDADRYYAGFTAYYEAGLSGRAQDQVRSDYAGDLTEAQKFAAYTAGQNDAAASLQREREGVQFATVYGDEAGFIPSEHSRNLSQDTVRFYNALGRATGTKITVTAATGEGGANGWYSNGTVYIAADAESAGSVVAKHEITHRLQEIAPEAYRTYRDYAVNALSEREGSSSALVERYKTRYAASGVNLTTEEAMDEIAADFTEALTVDPTRFELLASEHRSVARRVLDALKDFIRRVKSAFSSRRTQDRAAMSEYGVSMETLEEAARLWEDALRAGRAQVSAMTDEQQRVEFSDVNTRYSLRKKDPPEKTGIAYKVFYAKNGELYPPMVANPGGAGTPVGVWLDADVGQAAPPSKTGRAQVQAGGKGTNAAKGSLAFRPGWHLGDIPLAKQFARKNPDTGVKDLFPADFVWAECEYAMDVDYQEEAMSYGYTENGKFRHSYAGLPKLPTDGYYRYRTNPNPDTVPWIITGAMRVTRILTDAETDAICREAGVEPMKRQGGPLDEEKLAALGLEAGDVTDGTRFSLKSTDSQGQELSAEQRAFFRDSKVVDEDGQLLVVYHGTDADFTVFDRSRGRANMDIQGSFFSPWELDAQGYGGNVTAYYLNITNPADEATAYRALRRYQGQNEAGAKAREYLEKLGYDGVNNFGEEYIAFYPEQIKRVDNFSPTDDPDIRRSIRGGSDILRENAALQEENASLRERVEYWRGQTRRTTPGQVDKKAVDRAARELIRDFDSTISAADISGDLLSLYNYMGTGREGNDELTYTEARRRADDIARRVVESAQVTENGAYQEYRELREYLRTTPLAISQEDAADIPDYSDFRRRNFGRLNLRGGDTNIDQVYQELSEMWPEFFDETRENNPVDQLLHISEVAEQLYRTTTGNPFAGNLREAQAGVSNEILERFFDIPQVRATFADRAAQAVENERQRGRERVNRVREQRDARITQLREQNRERVQRAIQRERDTRERQLERMKNRYQARDTAGRERRTARELRARISRHVRDLSRRLLRPSDKQHIPEQLRTAVAAMLDAINLESVYTVDRSTGRRQKGGEGDPTKRTEAFRQLRQAYSEITKDGADYTLVIDPDLMDNLDELAAMRNIPLAEMSIPQLTTVWDTVKAVEASVRTANKMLGQSRFQTISQVANGLKDDNILRQDRGDFKGILGRVDKLVNMDMLTPQSYFHRLGKTGDSIFQMLRSAQDRQIEIMRDAETATRDIVGKTDINKLERETHTFQVDGGTVTLSTAQIMSLYELMKREQAQEHIFTGGIRPETIPGQRGLRESRRSAPAHVTAENLAEMVGTLTDEQVEMADKLQQYMGGRLSELGNEASMEVYGYRKFTEPHYFPIQVDRNQTQRDISKEVQAQTIAGRGFTKSTAPRANNAVMVNSIFDVYASHVNDMATYAAWLPTMENVRRIRDFTFRDGEGNRTGTVKDIIERVFGRNGNPYLNKLVDDLNQGVRSTADPGLMDRIVGNYKAASVSANLRVILQQPTAILRALNTLDAKYLLAGTVKRGDWQKVKQYAPIAQWKDWGYFDINTGRQMKNVLFDSDTRLERLRQAGMAGASAADSFTWARLWNAVEAETKDRRKDLKPGTKEFYQAVGQRFSEIVDQTQVVDGVLQRSHIMRSPDGLTKMTTSFMGEPTKSYNMFLNAVYDLRHATGKESRRTARRALVRTSVALAVSFTINAVMQSLVDGLRDDDKELDYWERVQRAFIGVSGDEESFLDYWNSFWSGNLEASYNPLSYMPYFKDLVSIIQGYDVSRMDAEALEKVFTSGKNFWQALNGEGRYSLAGASASFLAELSRLFGLSVANLKRDIQGTVTSAAIETDDYWLQYQIDKALLNIGYSGNRSGFMDILYAASVNDPEAYELIYDDMTASGITQEQIRTSMETRMREAQGVESVADLTRRYLTPDQERTYNRIYSQVTSSAIWSAASEEQQEAVEDDLYDLAAGTDAGHRLQEKINGGASYGISDGDYLLYLAAREIADAANEDPEKRNGSIDQSEAEAAIDMLTGLSNEARAYLWQSTNKGWSEKNNPYR